MRTTQRRHCCEFLCLPTVIEGPAKSNVADARRRVEIIVWTNRDRERPTHFISVPLTEPHLRDRVAEFSSAVLASCRRVGHLSWAVVTGTWHFSRREECVRKYSSCQRSSTSLSECCGYSLQKKRFVSPNCRGRALCKYAGESKSSGGGSYFPCKVCGIITHNFLLHSVIGRPLLGSDPVVVCVEGVDTMKDDPSAVDVLFARVFLTDKSDRCVAESFVIVNCLTVADCKCLWMQCRDMC